MAGASCYDLLSLSRAETHDLNLDRVQLVIHADSTLSSMLLQGDMSGTLCVQIVSKVARSMRKIPYRAKADDPVQVGFWKLKVQHTDAQRGALLPI